MSLKSPDSTLIREAGIFGYHGVGNYGDDIFLKVVTAWLADSFCCSQIKVFSHGQELQSSDAIDIIPVQKKFPFYRRFRLLDFVWQLSNADLLCFASGSIFGSIPSKFLKRLLQLRNSKRPPLLVVGVGVGLPSKIDLHLEQLLRQFEVLHLRDRNSFQLGESAKLKNMVPGDDIAIEYFAGASEARRDPGKRVIGVCINTDQSPVQIAAKAIDEILIALRRFAETEKISVRLLQACNLDALTTQKIARELGSANIETETIKHLSGNPQNLSNGISGCNALITTRMHPGICGMYNGLPVLQISYHPKIDDFFSNLELSDRDLLPIGNIDHGRIAGFLNTLDRNATALSNCEKLRARNREVKEQFLTIEKKITSAHSLRRYRSDVDWH